jgi:hypothetical protein
MDKSDWDGYKEGYDKGYVDGYQNGYRKGVEDSKPLPTPIAPYNPYEPYIVNRCIVCHMNLNYMNSMTCARLDCPNKYSYTPIVSRD